MFSGRVNFNNPLEVEEIKSFLGEFEIDYKIPDATYVIRDRGEIIGTGSLDGNILKYFYVREDFKGQGLMAILYKDMVRDLFMEGINEFFVFTKASNRDLFKSLGLREVLTTDQVSLLEGGFSNYKNWVLKLKSDLGDKPGKRGAVVLNANPMTLGHKYLIERALEEVDQLLVFVVQEDQSEFPFEVRYEIVREEMQDRPNVVVLKGGPYIISKGTFPTYFLKEKNEMLDAYTNLDGRIFGELISRDLEIDKRFFGSEPVDIVTRTYNENLKKILENKEIEVSIIDRKKLGKEVISASKARKLIKTGEFEKARSYLVGASKKFLDSERGTDLLNNIRELS